MKTCPVCGQQNNSDASICLNQGCLYSFDSALDNPMTELYTAEKPSFAPGSFISDRYEIVKELGRGGMGIVYLVKDIKLRNRLVALKITHPEIVSKEEARQRFKDEAILCLELLHPNIVRVNNLDEWNNCLYFTMEYIQGKNLRQFIDERQDKKPPFTLEEALLVINPLLDALSYAHKTTIHRDIKPENILILGEYPDIHVKVFDFGIAKVLSASRFTRTAQSMGTAYYMSPEQMQGAKHIDHRSDLYSIGMILYEMLTGKIAAGRFKLPSELVEHIPSEIDEIIEKALSPEPEGRLKDAQEMKSVLSKTVNTFLSGTVKPVEPEVTKISKPMENTPIHCPSCNFEIQVDWKACPGCGTPIDTVKIDEDNFKQKELKKKQPSKKLNSDKVLQKQKRLDLGKKKKKAVPQKEINKTDGHHGQKNKNTLTKKRIEKSIANISPALVIVQKKLKSSNWKLRREAVNFLNSLGSEAKVLLPDVSMLLLDDDEDVLKAASECLLKLGMNESCLPSIKRVISNSNWKIRRNVCNVVGKSTTNTSFAIPEIAKLIADKDEDVRKSVGKYLLKVGMNKSCLPSIKRGVSSSEWKIRMGVCGIVGDSAPSSSFAIESISKCLDDNDEDVRAMAEWSIKRMKGIKTSKPGNSGCFITTAICKSKNLPDDCRELNLMRQFRDTYMIETPELQKDVIEYYQIAPKIVSQVESSGQAKKIWTDLCEQYLLPAVAQCEKGDNDGAYHSYRSMMDNLTKKWLPES
ncbi:MAG: protein kinase [Desulfobacula sp.]|nr:protein kinase [Desulfobacula sp.]